MLHTGREKHTRFGSSISYLSRYALRIGAGCGLLLLLMGIVLIWDNPGAKHDRRRLVAAERVKEWITKFLAAGPNNLDAVDKNGATPLMWASEFGLTKCVEDLLKAGADPNIMFHDKKTGRGRTALMYATSHGKLECVRALLNSENLIKVNINDEDSHGTTALMLAITLNYSDCLQELLAAGATVTNTQSEKLAQLIEAETQFDQEQNNNLVNKLSMELAFIIFKVILRVPILKDLNQYKETQAKLKAVNEIYDRYEQEFERENKKFLENVTNGNWSPRDKKAFLADHEASGNAIIEQFKRAIQDYI